MVKTSSLRIEFRTDFPTGAESGGGGGQPKPARGEIFIQPRSEADRERLDIAALVLEQGLDGLVRGEGPFDCVMVPLGPSSPTLDDMLAASFAAMKAAGEEIPKGAETFARYAAVAREGLNPSAIPIEASLVGVFLAIRSSAPDNLADPKKIQKFLDGWYRLFERILSAARNDEDPFKKSMFDGGEGDQFARERAFLVEDQNVYRQDVSRGERWDVSLPGGPPTAKGLLLDDPKSALFKFWSRLDGDLFLAVNWGDGQWVFSTPPVQRLSLKSLADALQKSEAAVDATRAAGDPWFDGARFAHSLVASPKAGCRLSDEQVLRVVKQWCHARRVRPEARSRAWPIAAACAALLLAGILGAHYGPSWMDNRNSIEGGSTSKGRIASRDLDGINSAPPEFDPQKGKLHVLTIGVSRYKAGFNLTEPEKDATDLAAAFARQQSAFFQTSPPITLLNEKATKDAILVALDDLQREATVDDLVVVTLAGHGKVDERNRFFFLPYDYDPDKKLPTSSVSWDDFVWVLKSLPCMTLVIADTCHSGAITQFGFRDPDDSMKEVVDNAVNDFKQSPKGVIIFAACLRQSKALEHPKWHHGALSLAVLEAVTGVREFHAAHDTPLPVPNEQGLVTLESIRSYVIDRVKKLTEGRQDVVDNNSGNIHLAKVPIAIRTSPAVTPTKGKGGTVKDEE